MSTRILIFAIALILTSCSQQIDEDLVRASANGDVDQVQALIARGADLETVQMKEWTPMTAAANEGHVEALKVLIAAGAKIDGRAPGGVTPLQVAATGGQMDVVAYLLQAGADPNAIAPEARPVVIEAIRRHDDSSIEQLLLDHDFEVPPG